MKISFINAVASVCESVGANVNQVVHGVGTDARIGPRFLNPGIGYGGSCFPKDVMAFRAVARECGGQSCDDPALSAASHSQSAYAEYRRASEALARRRI